MAWLTALHVLCVLCFLPNFIDCRSIGLAQIADMNSIDVQVSYFMRYGYLERNFDLSKLTKEHSKESAQLFERAVRDFQAMMGLPVSGILDRDSLEVMLMPRCGLPDKFSRNNSRQKRYATFNGLRLDSNNISFGIEPNSYTNDLSRDKTREILRRALQMWSDIADISFYEKTNPTIEFRFARLGHNDNYDFDGPGGTLAHAFPPIYSNLDSPSLGDVHLDDDEEWTDESYTGRNLFQVVTHELGHSLGLNHTDVQTAVMAPVYRGYNRYFAMTKDDIEGIQSLYGKPPVGRPTNPPKARDEASTDPGNPKDCIFQYCRCSHIDAISTTHDRNLIFAFNDKYIYQMDPWTGIKAGFPKFINEIFPGFSGTVDAALTWPKDDFKQAYVTTFFLFQEDYVYTYHLHDNGTILLRAKDRISDRFPGVSGPVNVSLVWSGNSMTYFFSGTQYYRLTTNGDGRVHEDYPRPLAAWGFPGNMVPDSGFQYYNTYTYFFFGNSYYRYNDQKVEVEQNSYPRTIGQWWFGCEPLNLVDENSTNRRQREPMTRLEVENIDRLSFESDLQANGSTAASLSLMNVLSVLFYVIIGIGLW